MVDKSFTEGLGRHIITGVVMALIGAGITLLMSAGGERAKIEAISNKVDRNDLRITSIEQNLANGGPAPLEKRVTAIEDRMLNVEKMINGIYSVVVLNQKPR